MKAITFPVVLDGYSPRKDKCVSIRFITQEKTSDEIREIHENLDRYGILYFRGEEQLTKSERDALDNIDIDLTEGRKTQSQRIRNTLYKLWEQEPKGMVFKEFYKHHTELIIEWLKNKLE